MNNKIDITISSLFKGEGFKKTNQAIRNVSKSAKDAAKGLSAVAGEMGQMGAAAGKLDGLGKILGSFSAGPIGVAVAALGALVGGLMKYKESIDETRKHAQEMIEKMEDGYAKRISEAIDKARKKQSDFLDELIKKGGKALERLQALHQMAKDMADARKGTADAQLGLDIANIQRDAARRKTFATTDEEKKEIDLDAQQKVLAKKREKAQSDHTHAIEQSAKDEKLLNEQVKELEMQIGEQQSQQRKITSLNDQQIQKHREYIETLQNRRTAIMKSRDLTDAQKDEKVEKIGDKILEYNQKIADLQEENLAKSKKQMESEDEINRRIGDTKRRIAVVQEKRRAMELSHNAEIAKLDAEENNIVESRHELMRQTAEKKWKADEEKREKEKREKKEKEEKARKDAQDKIDKRLAEIKKELQKISADEDVLAQRVREDEDRRRNDPNSQVTGEGRKEARNALKDANAERVKQENRENARQNRMRNLERMAARRGGAHWLTDRQKKELRAWWAENNNRQALAGKRKTKKELQEEQARLEKNAQQLPNNVMDIKDNVQSMATTLQTFVNQNKVK